MKSAKIVGIVFVVCGILFAIIGTVAGTVHLMEKDDCKYATAYIVKIDEKKTGDPEFPIEHTTYVEFDINGNQMNGFIPSSEEVDMYYVAYDPKYNDLIVVEYTINVKKFLPCGEN